MYFETNPDSFKVKLFDYVFSSLYPSQLILHCKEFAVKNVMFYEKLHYLLVLIII